MKIAHVALTGLVALSGLLPLGSAARAQNYPWCAHYSGGFDGTNCGFTTRRQCLATVFGVGGDCEPNLQYRPPPGPHPRAAPRRRRYQD